MKCPIFSLLSNFRAILLFHLIVCSTCALLLMVGTSFAADKRAFSLEELPLGATPAFHWWTHRSSSGFGRHSTTYPYTKHPGYWVGNQELIGSAGWLVKNPAAVYSILKESEDFAIANSNVEALYRTYLGIWISGGFIAKWDADYRNSLTNEIVFRPGYAHWNFALYSGRACQTDYERWVLVIDSTVEEFFCAPRFNLVKPQNNQGEPQSCGLHKANPVHIGTGNKFQKENILPAIGNSPLRFDIYYNSLDVPGQEISRGKWSFSYTQRISGYLENLIANYTEMQVIAPSAKYLSLEVFREDGRRIQFTNELDWESGSTVSSVWNTTDDSVYKLSSINDPGSGMIVFLDLSLPDGTKERYSLAGKLQSIEYPGGRNIELQYDQDGSLTEVTDTFGRSLLLSMHSSGRITQIKNPAGDTFRISYDALGNLQSVIYPDLTPSDDADNPRRIYHYDNLQFPFHLTGITDESGSRFAAWTYDSAGRAVSSEHADGSDSYSMVYNLDGTTSVTDPLGNTQTYAFTVKKGVMKISSVTEGQCGSCNGESQAYDYDDSGFVISKTDFNGNTTRYVRDERGLELSRTEAFGTHEERTISTEWHQDFYKPIRIDEPGKITFLTYDVQGNLLSRNEQVSQ